MSDKEFTDEEITQFFVFAFVAVGPAAIGRKTQEFVKFREKYWAEDPRMDTPEIRRQGLVVTHPLCVESYASWCTNRATSSIRTVGMV